jgi:antitoxin Phd
VAGIRGDWQVQEAKSRLSELISEARTVGPQAITRHGKPMVVVMSIEDFEKMHEPQTTLVECLGALNIGDIEFERAPDTKFREIDF